MLLMRVHSPAGETVHSEESGGQIAADKLESPHCPDDFLIAIPR